MDYGQARAFVKETGRYGRVYGLDSIRSLMARLGNVQEQVPYLHVAGTNGKGSVCAMLAALLQAQGYRTGLYASPAVLEPEEIIKVNGIPVSKENFAKHAKAVQKACQDMINEGLPHPTAFEVETAIAFCYFQAEKCEIALLETGLGGELDATNLITHPVCSILTSVSRDHMAVLGETLQEIASAKTGIIKPGCPCVTAAQKPEVMEVIRKAAQEKQSELWEADSSFISRFVYDGRGSSFETAGGSSRESSAEVSGYEDQENSPELSEHEKQAGSGTMSGNERNADDRPGLCGQQGRMQPGLCGEHGKQGKMLSDLYGMHGKLALTGAFQKENLACVLTAVSLLSQKGFPVSAEAVLEGLSKTRLPGRFDKICEKPDFYMDGAHNEGAALLLRETVRNCFTNRRIVYIIGVLADKEYEKVLQIMLPYAAEVFTVTPDDPRALDGRELARRASEYHAAVTYIPKIPDAAVQAVQAAGADGAVLAFGSFSYLGELKQAVKDQWC